MSAIKYYDTTSGTWKYLSQGPKGDAGPTGTKGDTGATGATGAGVPTGGSTGQALVKNSGTDYDTTWTTIATGTSSKSKFDAFLVNTKGPVNYYPAANTALISSTSSSAISGATRYTYDSGKFYFRGLNSSVITNSSGTNYYRNNADFPSNNSVNPFWVEFDYYGSNFDVRYNSRGSSNAQLWVWVDGVPATAAAVKPTSTNDVDSYYNVTLPSTAQRRIRVMLARADFGGIGTASVTDTIFPVEQKLLKVALFDGSWFAGGAGGATNVSDYLSVQLGEMLNVDYYVTSVSGTGYVRGTNTDPILGVVTDASAGGPNWCDPTRLSVLTAISPDLVVFIGSSNDDGFTASNKKLDEHVTYVYNYILNNVPNAKIVTFTRQSNTETSASIALNASTVYTAASASSNVIGVVNIYSEGWITGTSNSSNPNNTGNGQIYIYSDVHPNAAGNKYYASRLFNRISDIVKTYTRS
jgi:hypothetical protein